MYYLVIYVINKAYRHPHTPPHPTSNKFREIFFIQHNHVILCMVHYIAAFDTKILSIRLLCSRSQVCVRSCVGCHALNCCLNEPIYKNDSIFQHFHAIYSMMPSIQYKNNTMMRYIKIRGV